MTLERGYRIPTHPDFLKRAHKLSASGQDIVLGYEPGWHYPLDKARLQGTLEEDPQDESVIVEAEKIRAKIDPNLPPLTKEEIEAILEIEQATSSSPSMVPERPRLLATDLFISETPSLILSRESAIAEVTGPIHAYTNTEIDQGLNRIHRDLGRMALSARRNRNVNDNGRKA